MTPAGIHEMSMEAYQRDPCPAPSLSSGIAHVLNSQSPRHAWTAHPRLNPGFVAEDRDKFDLGSCAHAVLLEGEDAIAAIDPAQYPGKKGGIPDGWTNQAIRDARDFARSQGKIPVLADKLADIRLMANEARMALLELDGMPISLTEGTAERVLIWQEENGVWCRARPDWRHDNRKILLDYKSTEGSAEPGAWIRNQLTKMGYDMQGYHYLRGNVATGGDKASRFIFLVQENYAPFECSFVELSSGMLEIAQRKWEFAAELWRRCLETNRWKGYPRRLATAEPMLWQADEDEERRLTFEERLEYMTV